MSWITLRGNNISNDIITLLITRRYFIERAGTTHTKRSFALIQRSFFRPLTRVRYELIGQDRALEQLFRVLSMRSRELTVAPIVVLLCGMNSYSSILIKQNCSRSQWAWQEFACSEVYVSSSTFFHKLRIVFPLVGSLLDVPTHTVNMTTLRSSHDLWQSYSMSPYEVRLSFFDKAILLLLNLLLGDIKLHFGRIPHK